MEKIGIIDYGAGNFTSVWNAIKSIYSDLIRVTKKEQLQECSKIILPGVGAFNSAMKKLDQMGILDEMEKQVVFERKHFLGICVGMQILAEKGFEFGESQGLGYLPATVEKLSFSKNLILPHIGWNSLVGKSNSPLFKGIEEDASFYFVHSYHMLIKSKGLKPVHAVYGEEFVAAISRENIHGVQFHPEKSQYYGIKLLNNFISLDA